MIRPLFAASLVLACLLMGACGWVPSRVPLVGGTVNRLTIDSQSTPGTQLVGAFTDAVYHFESPQTLLVILYEGDIESPTQAAVLRMFWRPRAGATPISPDATNTTIQYVILPEAGGDREAGVYSGAGYLYPRNRPGADVFQGSLWQANLQLSDRTDRFTDILGKALAGGEIQARHDEVATKDLLRTLHQAISQRLGYPRLVRADDTLRHP